MKAFTPDHPQIMALLRKTKAAHEEFEQAMAYHEAWKPAAFDADVHANMGQSRATNTFFTIRLALRREMILALLRMWDGDQRSVSLSSLRRTLLDRRVVECLCNIRRDYWSSLQWDVADDTEGHPAIAEIARGLNDQEAEAEVDKLKVYIGELTNLIAIYEFNGLRHEFLNKLRRLRDVRLAHREVENATVAPYKPDFSNQELEEFYQNVARIISHLRFVVEYTHYNPTEFAKVREHNAKLFWAGVRGEATEGHPAYVRPPNRTLETPTD